MSYYQGNDLRKPSGGLKGEKRGKRKHELGSPPTNTTLSNSEEKVFVRTLGGNMKVKLKKALYINVALPGEKTAKKVKILDVVETPSNPQNTRFKIISKGTVVKTELGLVKVTSRPGQHGVLNGVLVEKK
ncbi:30S ribosomal protein S8e [Desulfurococcus mucosus]|uniref:Small ribosomal subunit protein eS8 n=1 Tax=Desulfurococcus mucosus (strain ATCC 35584 / DSM 2162 / JCM 9187 / O7/1) TaxID=765177 RepID=E8R715_DESM0|nr:30S ribosomal protein S8e [Desulfurococcus mucosus]ADV64448.1 SSU ribosomal protein S8E [Desulfurococcus mucosus DSM 2162]